jgi:hypothetical protein
MLTSVSMTDVGEDKPICILWPRLQESALRRILPPAVTPAKAGAPLYTRHSGMLTTVRMTDGGDFNITAA